MRPPSMEDLLAMGKAAKLAVCPLCGGGVKVAWTNCSLVVNIKCARRGCGCELNVMVRRSHRAALKTAEKIWNRRV